MSGGRSEQERGPDQGSRQGPETGDRRRPGPSKIEQTHGRIMNRLQHKLTEDFFKKNENYKYTINPTKIYV